MLSSNTGGPTTRRWGRFFGVNDSTDAADGRHRADHGWLRRHWIAVTVVVLVTLATAGVGGWLYSLNQLVEDVEKVAVTLREEDRPPPNTGKDMNILLAGADNGSGKSIAEEIAAGTWSPGEHRSDTIMVLHVPAHRQRAFLISIPRDSYVEIYDETGKPTGRDKINAAFSAYGPSGYIATVEELTGLRMDHLAIMDWKGFKDLSTAVGGVEVCIPETFYDESQQITWEKGCREIEGEEALAYVRTRHGLENGDFDRIKRQQNFMRALMGKVLADESSSGVDGLTDALRAVTKNLTVDEDWGTDEIRRFALSMRGLETEQVTFLTAPLKRYDYTDDGQSIVLLDGRQSRVLWRAVEKDRVSKYLRRYGAEAGALGDPGTVG